MLLRYALLAGSAVACGSPTPPAPTPVAHVREVPDNDAGVRATNDVRVTKRPAKADSCWMERSCSDALLCQAPEDPTFGGCPVPGCRERGLHESCTSNLDCWAGYSCVLGPNEWRGRGDAWHCEAIRCATDSDCLSANMRCGNGGICTAIPCTKSSECDGYCLGTCNAKPGTCVPPHPLEKRP